MLEDNFTLNLNTLTRWTFFRVKLIFEYDFEISWSLGPRDPWTFKLWNLWTLGLSIFLLLPSYTTSSYFFLPPSSWFGFMWFGMGGQMTSEFICEENSILFHSSSNLLPPPYYSSQLIHPPHPWWRHCNYRVKLQVQVS